MYGPPTQREIDGLSDERLIDEFRRASMEGCCTNNKLEIEGYRQGLLARLLELRLRIKKLEGE